MTMPKLKKRILEIGNRECYNKGNRGEKSMKIIMRADDLGFSEAVNHGICKAVKDGVITSVGMMPNMKAARHGYELIKDMDGVEAIFVDSEGGIILSDESIPFEKY